ncbi:hypothetical protein ACER0A_014005 [Haloimpatiens sp. FM7315]|uniref:hypothetical protein n=1 Tax=Haloimpatiens sp. FM7315 TaxID=3298609 RepID=UPI0035A39422
MEDNNCFVKIAYELGDKEAAVKHYESKLNQIKNKSYNGKYLIGGGFYSKESGWLIFKAKDVKEAKELAYNNSFVRYKGIKYRKLSVTMFT